MEIVRLLDGDYERRISANVLERAAPLASAMMTRPH